jgi:hypothetical protein
MPRQNIKIGELNTDNVDANSIDVIEADIFIQESDQPPKPKPRAPKPRARKPKQPTEEELKLEHEKKTIELQLESYRKSDVFQDELDGIDWSNEDRKALLDEVERKTQGAVSIDYLSMVYLAFQKIEDIINTNTNDRFLGLARNLYEDYNIRKNLELLKIRYLSVDSEFVQMSPEYSLVLSIAFVAVKTYITNIGKEEEEYEYED